MQRNELYELENFSIVEFINKWGKDERFHIFAELLNGELTILELCDDHKPEYRHHLDVGDVVPVSDFTNSGEWINHGVKMDWNVD